MFKKLSLVIVVAMLCACGNAQKNLMHVEAPKDFNGIIFYAKNSGDHGKHFQLGYANFEELTPFTIETRSQVGSVSKFFTTLVVLRLVDQQKLSLNQPIGTILKDLPKQTGQIVTVRHLLSNTSGIPDAVSANLKKDPSLRKSEADAIASYAQWSSGDLTFVPGKGWDYSVTNWILIKAIIETVSADNFNNVILKELVEPLALKNTGIPAYNFPESVSDADNYSINNKSNVPSYIPPFAAASGSFYSSVADLRRMMDGIYHGGYLSNERLKELESVNYADQHYALGGRVLMKDGRLVLKESGKTANYRALVIYTPHSGEFKAVLNNTGLDQGVIEDIAGKLK